MFIKDVFSTFGDYYSTLSTVLLKGEFLTLVFQPINPIWFHDLLFGSSFSFLCLFILSRNTRNVAEPCPMTIKCHGILSHDIQSVTGQILFGSLCCNIQSVSRQIWKKTLWKCHL